jgi:hypothetical protein
MGENMVKGAKGAKGKSQFPRHTLHMLFLRQFIILCFGYLI